MSIECQEFYELMQTYRHCPMIPPGGPAAAYQDVIKFVNEYADRKVQEALAIERGEGDEEEEDAPPEPNPVELKRLCPSDALAWIVGPDSLPRTEVTRRVWDYIKVHNLQDPTDRKMINADVKLKAVLGGKERVSMFELTKLISENLT